VSLITGPSLVLLGLAVGDWRSLAGASGRDIILLVSAALLGITFGHALLYRAIRGIGAVATEGGLLAMPFVTAVMAAGILGERMGAVQWLGGTLVLAGCAVLLRVRVSLPADEAQS